MHVQDVVLGAARGLVVTRSQLKLQRIREIQINFFFFLIKESKTHPVVGRRRVGNEAHRRKDQK